MPRTKLVKKCIICNMKLFVTLYFLLISLYLWPQDEIIYDDYVYLPHIKSVQFHHRGLPTSTPIVDLQSSGQLQLSFDDILGGDITYTYKIIHCDKDWQPSRIEEFQYVDGFNDEDIQKWYYSSGTKTDYTHYQLIIPNNNTRWLLSGNYLLAVYDDDLEVPALTRRFVVADNQINILASVERSSQVQKIRSHHQIEIELDTKEYQISNPRQELFVTVIPNGRWDRSIDNIRPVTSIGRRVKFDISNRINFAAGKEYRFADLRSMRFNPRGVYEIISKENGYDVLMELDEPRRHSMQFEYDDLNGHFIPGISDRPNATIHADYVNVNFGLIDKSPPKDASVHLIGDFNDWQCTKENKMDYDYKNKGLYVNLLLKQGYYDYQYALVKDGLIDEVYYEGSDYRTKNEYIVLVYYRKFGDRYDRVIATRSLQSPW